MAWMGTQLDLEAIIARNRRKVMSMVHRFNARYVLDGGLAWAALKSYSRSFAQNPKIALQEWHRILFAVLSLVGLRRLGEWYYHIQRQKIPASVQVMGITNVDALYSDQG